MRTLSVFGALVLAASMCLAFPAAAASVDDSIRMDAIAHAGADFIAPSFVAGHAIVAVDAFDMAAVDAPALVDPDPAQGAGSSFDVVPALHASGKPFDFARFDVRRHDPGWRGA